MKALGRGESIGDVRQLREKMTLPEEQRGTLVRDELICHVDRQQEERETCPIFHPSFKAPLSRLHEQLDWSAYRDDLVERRRPNCRQDSGPYPQHYEGSLRRKSTPFMKAHAH